MSDPARWTSRHDERIAAKSEPTWWQGRRDEANKCVSARFIAMDAARESAKGAKERDQIHDHGAGRVVDSHGDAPEGQADRDAADGGHSGSIAGGAIPLEERQVGWDSVSEGGLILPMDRPPLAGGEGSFYSEWSPLQSPE